MFDIGFSEIVVIAVVALVVIGPEKLPKTARTLGVLFGRLQRYVGDVKADISREMELDELRRLQKEMQSTASELTQSVKSAAQDLESSAREVETALNATAATAAAPAGPSIDQALASAEAATASTDAAVDFPQTPGTGAPDVAPDTMQESSATLPQPIAATMAGDAAKPAPGTTVAAPATTPAAPGEAPRQAALPGFDTI